MTLNRVNTLKIACIVDDFTEYCLAKECQLINLDIHTWEQQLEELKPDFLFVESAWRGYQNQWNKKISVFSMELAKVIYYCKQNTIPTVFWNKEDPVHFDTFFTTALQFDLVFTTDMDSIPLYKLLLHHNNVGLFPFATSPKVFHPIEVYDREDAICFAGSYYRNRINRSETFEAIYDICKKYMNFYIYDRNAHPEDINYTYPDKYKDSILGSLPVDQIDIAYKKYRFGLTMNTVQDSSTMEARRVFELMSSNTITISNECRAITNMLGDLCVVYLGEESSLEIAKLLNDEEYYNKLRLLALRTVLLEHTYEKRLLYIAQKVLKKRISKIDKQVVVYSIVCSQEEVNLVLKAFQRQSYQSKKLIFIVEENSNINTDTEKISFYPDMKVADLGVSDYYACFTPSNYYGINYLMDCILAQEYSDAKIIGKGSYYTNCDNQFLSCGDYQIYTWGNEMILDRCIMQYDVAKDIAIDPDVIGSNKVTLNCLYIDQYNFCENYTKETCDTVDDLSMNTGYKMEELYKVSESLQPSMASYQKKLTGNMIFDEVKNNAKYVSLAVDDTGGLNVIPHDIVKGQVYLYSNAIYDVSEYERANKISICFRCLFSGVVKLLVVFIDEREEVIKRIVVLPNSYQKITIPQGSKQFTLCFAIKSQSRVKIQEIYLNPMIRENLKIDSVVKSIS